MGFFRWLFQLDDPPTQRIEPYNPGQTQLSSETRIWAAKEADRQSFEKWQNDRQIYGR